MGAYPKPAAGQSERLRQYATAKDSLGTAENVLYEVAVGMDAKADADAVFLLSERAHQLRDEAQKLLYGRLGADDQAVVNKHFQRWVS